MSHQVLLYYKYAYITDPVKERDAQRELCNQLGLRGRILVGHEGINGTVGGTAESCRKYMEYMHGHSSFTGTEFKIDSVSNVPFGKLIVKVRDEVVTLGQPVDHAKGGKRLTPDEFHQMASDPNVVLLDTRNNYESAIGRFKGAVTPDINLFKKLPEALNSYQDLKNKTVITYCTGGIRCEKASALMVEQGFKDVYQLQGGIVEYAKKYPDGHFEGECYVFDDRISVAFKDNPELLGACIRCNVATNRYINCAYKPCNKQAVMCQRCCADHADTCCDSCLELVKTTSLSVA